MVTSRFCVGDLRPVSGRFPPTISHFVFMVRTPRDAISRRGKPKVLIPPGGHCPIIICFSQLSQTALYDPSMGREGASMFRYVLVLIAISIALTILGFVLLFGP